MKPSSPHSNHETDTIAAVATPPGLGGIAVVRVSGPGALTAANSVFRRPDGSSIEAVDLPSHTVHYGYAVHPVRKTRADEVLMIIMKGPRTYTGEDVVEFNCHGGPVPVDAVLGAVLAGGARMAEPGEFTRRAFLNGRMDLSQAEAVVDVIEARSRAGARLALGQLEGRLGRMIRKVRSELLDVMAQLEVVLDYPEMNIDEQDRRETGDQLKGIADQIQDLIDTASRSRPFREGVRTAIIGRPNVGKSSLLNALLQRERAIVTELPGTTRDVLEETIVVRGIPLVLMDTAGLRMGTDRAEQLGVERARRAAGEAELVLLVVDDSEPLTNEDREAMREAGLNEAENLIAVVNKVDLEVGAVSTEDVRGLVASDIPAVRISALTRDGLQVLEQRIVETVLGDADGGLEMEGAVVSSARHEESLRRAGDAMAQAVEALGAGMPVDLVSVDLRESLQALGTITGETATDDLLDRIFSRFCVGK